MHINELFVWGAGGARSFWKMQMTLGILVVLAGVLVAVFPEILVAVVAAGIIMVGLALIGSAWRLRQWQDRRPDPWEW